MDGFKVHEVARMEQSGGNDAWRAFFDAHEMIQTEGRTFDDSTIQERYSGLVGEEWKEMLSAKIEGRTYLPPSKEELQKKKAAAAAAAATAAAAAAAPTAAKSELSRSGTPSRSISSSHTGSPNLSSPAATATRLGNRSNESFGNTPMTRKQANEAYFARKGAQNAQRPEGVPPAQGGKYSGFGGGMPVEVRNGRSETAGVGLPGLDSFQQDSMAALSKGFGWFTSTIGKSAKQVHEGYLQPAAKSLAASDFAAQARTVAQQGFQNIQSSARGAATQFNRFVEGAIDERSADQRFTTSHSSPSMHTPVDQQNRASSYNSPSLSPDDPIATSTTNNATSAAAAAAEPRRNQSLSPSRIGVSSPGGGSAGSGSIGTAAMRNRGGQSSASATPLSDKSKAGTGSSWKNDDGWDDDW
ncbi:Zn finger-containing GTPase- Activating Protein for ARF [Ascosphaera aggregata]|nr:Zn finger-containing GTPase- Activating Protein for ARF [Ascosphaera aggregata]